MQSGQNKTARKKDRLAARLTRGSQPGRARVAGKRFTKDYQPKGRGRRKGVPNIITREVKEAILAACKAVGSDGHGKDGLTGYMMFLAREYPPTMGMLLLAVMRTQVTVERIERPEPYQTYEQMCAELKQQYGIKLDRPVYKLEFYKGPVVELDEDVTNNTDDAKDR
jgi:hypothetical protein